MSEIKGLENKIVYFYDIEVFPNFFSALFISEDFKDEFVFYKYKDKDDIPAMIQFVQQENLLLVGYNSLGYDDIIMKAIIENYSPVFRNRNIYNISKKIIGTRDRRKLPESLREIMWSDTPWLSADMMALLEINTNRPSLKHCAIHLEHHRLQDLPKPFDAKVTDDEVETILDYNRNDVEITGKLWHHEQIQEAIELRMGLGERYGVNLISANDSKIANVILEAAYGKPKRKATRRKLIKGKDLIPPTLEFKTPTMLTVRKTIEKLHLIERESDKGSYYHLTYPGYKVFEHIFEFNGVTFKLAKGGLHSDDPPRMLRSTDEYIIRDCDVTSYYPALRQVYGLVPGHLEKARFLEVDAGIIKERVEGKKAGDKVTAEGLKICINGIFGKMNFQYFWLYDPLPFYQTTLFGQLLLLMLIEMLYLEGIECLSANTDGIVCKIPRDKEQVYYETCIKWQQATGMGLEYTDYNFLVQLNVNSYMSHAIAEHEHDSEWNIVSKEIDKVKTKKDFTDNKELTKQSFVKGYQAPVIAKALQDYFKEGTPVSETIMNEDNVHNFFYTQKTGGKFELRKRWADAKEEVLQKTNRYYITNSGYVLVKKDKTEYTIWDEYDDRLFGGGQRKSKTTRETSMWKGNYSYVLNDITDERPKVNRQFYVDKATEIVEEIEPPQVIDIFSIIG